MNEADFKKRWEEEKPVYNAWGSFIVSKVQELLSDNDINPSNYLKIQASHRVKDNASLLTKAFYRNKNYADPFDDIEDKVGARFVVLLVEHVKFICELIEKSGIWKIDRCKSFLRDRDHQPEYFTYQSVHYILRPKEDFSHEGVTVPAGTPCEVQVRTLLQHAHAELTHDSIYKSKKIVKPEVKRVAAQGMALVETTDDLFEKVVKKLNDGPLTDHKIINKLDSLYQEITDTRPSNIPSLSLSIWDAFEEMPFVNEDLIDSIRSDLMTFKDEIAHGISQNYEIPLFQDSSILFVLWMLRNNKRMLLDHWFIDGSYLRVPANVVGVSIDGF